MPRSVLMVGDEVETVMDFDLSTAAHHPDEFHPVEMLRVENALAALRSEPGARLPPILVLNGKIVDGKARCLAYHIMGMRYVPAVIVRRGT